MVASNQEEDPMKVVRAGSSRAADHGGPSRSAGKERQTMTRLSIRRAFAGLALAALLTAAPASAAGFQVEKGLQLSDLWSRAWSWLADLWAGGDSGTGAEASRGYGKCDSKPGPPPGPPPPGRLGGQTSGLGGGDDGSGIDPDG